MNESSPPFRILFADDEETFRQDIVAALSRRGYDVIAAASGREALDRLESDDFHLLITDVKMPPPDGLELLRWVKQERPQTEVLILTGQRELLEDPAGARDAIRGGAFDYLSKPVSLFDAKREKAEIPQAKRDLARRRLANVIGF